MRSFKEFLTENKNVQVTEAKDDFMGTYKHKGGDRVDVWVKGLNKAMKAAGVDKEYIEDDYYSFLGQEVYDALMKAMQKGFKTKMKDAEGKAVKFNPAPKKIIVQY